MKNPDLLRGTTKILVLAVLEKKDMYGYKITREIELRSDNAFSLGEGTLYPILHTLEKEKCIESYWKELDGRNRKYYHITKKGLRKVNALKEERVIFNRAVDKVLNFG